MTVNENPFMSAYRAGLEEGARQELERINELIRNTGFLRLSKAAVLAIINEEGETNAKVSHSD